MTTKTKPETRQEMAEWLAVDFFNGHGGSMDKSNGWFVQLPGNLVPNDFFTEVNWIEHIYSPDGFFAVRDAIKKKLGYGTRIEHNFVTDGRETCYICRHIEGIEWAGNGANEYEAFYNAVWEAWE